MKIETHEFLPEKILPKMWLRTVKKKKSKAFLEKIKGSNSFLT